MIEPIYLIIVPLLAGFSLLFIDLYLPKITKGFILTISLGIFILGINLIVQVLKEPVFYNLGNWKEGVGISLIIDPLGGVMVITIVFISLFIIYYSLDYIKENQRKYYTLLFLLLGGMLGLVLTGDLFNLFVFLEITSIASYALVAFDKKDISFEASFKYLIIGSISGFFVLLGIILVYQTTGTLNLAQLVIEAGSISFAKKKMILTLFLVGFGAKFALVPLHTWLPDAHPAAPSPISALLSGVVIKVYLYALVRLLFVIFNLEELLTSNLNFILIYLGVVSLLLGHLLAYQQQNLKRMLAYSTISQVGYIMIGIGAFTADGLIGGIYHIINHALVKSALFLTAGVFISKLKAYNISELKGAGYKLPFNSLLFTISALILVGLPPSNVFISKWLIAKAALESDFVIPAFSIFIGSILSLIYYLRVIKEIYTGSKEKITSSITSWNLKLPPLIFSLCCFVIAIFSNVIFEFIMKIPLFLLEPMYYYKILLGG